MHKIQADRSWPLHGTSASRTLEQLSQATLPPHTLMRRAGLAVARLARAIAPHARHAWIACGPGNNGGDGFEAALHLQQLGWQVSLTWAAGPRSPADAQASRERALAAGLKIQQAPPAHFDLAIDALLGLGGQLSADHPGSALMDQWLTHMHDQDAPVLAVDLPTGLEADTGARHRAPPGQSQSRSQRHTLSLLTLKPGLFTAEGRDLAGQVWWDALGTESSACPATAWLIGADLASWPLKANAWHASHKGSFGDVIVVGGQQTGEATSMAGAALLAARAALHGGAGRVYVSLLGQPSLNADPAQPELMFRPASSLEHLGEHQVVVAGCGGGSAIAASLPGLLAQPCRLVLDADALNALAADPRLRHALVERNKSGGITMITPHPLEAARLLGCSTHQIQADRLRAAQELAAELQCVVVLKGSGTVVASPGHPTCINFTGNALLASAGTGDVLSGLLGAALARGVAPRQAAMQAVHEHGRRADVWLQRHPQRVLTASELAGNAAHTVHTVQ